MEKMAEEFITSNGNLTNLCAETKRRQRSFLLLTEPCIFTLSEFEQPKMSGQDIFKPVATGQIPGSITKRDDHPLKKEHIVSFNSSSPGYTTLTIN